MIQRNDEPTGIGILRLLPEIAESRAKSRIHFSFSHGLKSGLEAAFDECKPVCLLRQIMKTFSIREPLVTGCEVTWLST